MDKFILLSEAHDKYVEDRFLKDKKLPSYCLGSHIMMARLRVYGTKNKNKLIQEDDLILLDIKNEKLLISENNIAIDDREDSFHGKDMYYNLSVKIFDLENFMKEDYDN